MVKYDMPLTINNWHLIKWLKIKGFEIQILISENRLADLFPESGIYISKSYLKQKRWS